MTISPCLSLPSARIRDVSTISALKFLFFGVVVVVVAAEGTLAM